MIVEFMGLPGAGKSSLGRALEQELARRGLHCLSVVERSRTTVGGKLLSKLAHVCVQTSPQYRREKKKLLRLAKDALDRPPRYNKDGVRLSDYLEQAAFLRVLYARLEKSRTLYLFDEGIAQQFVTMTVNYELDENTLRSLLQALGELPNIVYITCERETAKAAIRKRDRHTCYIDELRGEELDGFLTAYQRACEQLAALLSPTRLDREANLQTKLAAVLQETRGEERK